MSGGQKRWGKRSIEATTQIDGFKLCWRLRSEPQASTEHGHEGLSIAVQRIDGAFLELVLQFPIPMQKRYGALIPAYFPLRPKISSKEVEVGIRLAIAGGWNSESRGRTFFFQVPSEQGRDF